MSNNFSEICYFNKKKNSFFWKNLMWEMFSTITLRYETVYKTSIFSFNCCSEKMVIKNSNKLSQKMLVTISIN